MFYKRTYALRTLSMWRVRSSILLEKPHSQKLDWNHVGKGFILLLCFY